MFFSPVMWFVHPLSIIQLEPPEQDNLGLGFRYPTLVGFYKVSYNSLRDPNASLVSLAFGPYLFSNYFFIFT